MAQQSVSVAIAFHSGMGHTAAAASAFAEGVASIPGAAPELLQLTDDQVSGGRWHDEKIMGVLTAADAIVFGAPTYMGMVSWQFKAFADATAPMWMTSG
jgi:NAD(P)H dehydrogenase (quinone)